MREVRGFLARSAWLSLSKCASCSTQTAHLERETHASRARKARTSTEKGTHLARYKASTFLTSEWLVCRMARPITGRTARSIALPAGPPGKV